MDSSETLTTRSMRLINNNNNNNNLMQSEWKKIGMLLKFEHVSLQEGALQEDLGIDMGGKYQNKSNKNNYQYKELNSLEIAATITTITTALVFPLLFSQVGLGPAMTDVWIRVK